MENVSKYRQLRGEVAALRFINEQTGYDLDIRKTIERKYIFEKIFDKEGSINEGIGIGLTIATMGLPMLAGLVSAAVALKGFVSPKVSGLGGAVLGLITGGFLHHYTLGRWERSYSMVKKAKAYKGVYDSEGIEGLIAKDMGFDKF